MIHVDRYPSGQCPYPTRILASLEKAGAKLLIDEMNWPTLRGVPRLARVLVDQRQLHLAKSENIFGQLQRTSGAAVDRSQALVPFLEKLSIARGVAKLFDRTPPDHDARTRLGLIAQHPSLCLGRLRALWYLILARCYRADVIVGLPTATAAATVIDTGVRCTVFGLVLLGLVLIFDRQTHR